MSAAKNLSIIISSPVLWNDEEPRLYELWLSVGDGGRLLDLAVRRFEIKDGVCLLNGKAVKARGINRHDSHPVTGHAVTLDDMLGDIMLIKRANCNMIRTSHYPNDPRFLELCDRYGIMLTDEADIETHGMGYDWEGEWDWMRWSRLSSSPEWREAYVDRAKRLFGARQKSRLRRALVARQRVGSGRQPPRHGAVYPLARRPCADTLRELPP